MIYNYKKGENMIKEIITSALTLLTVKQALSQDLQTNLSDTALLNDVANEVLDIGNVVGHYSSGDGKVNNYPFIYRTTLFKDNDSIDVQVQDNNFNKQWDEGDHIEVGNSFKFPVYKKEEDGFSISPGYDEHIDLKFGNGEGIVVGTADYTEKQFRADSKQRGLQRTKEKTSEQLSKLRHIYQRR